MKDGKTYFSDQIAGKIRHKLKAQHNIWMPIIVSERIKVKNGKYVSDELTNKILINKNILKVEKIKKSSKDTGLQASAFFQSKEKDGKKMELQHVDVKPGQEWNAEQHIYLYDPKDSDSPTLIGLDMDTFTKWGLDEDKPEEKKLKEKIQGYRGLSEQELQEKLKEDNYFLNPTLKDFQEANLKAGFPATKNLEDLVDSKEVIVAEQVESEESMMRRAAKLMAADVEQSEKLMLEKKLSKVDLSALKNSEDYTYYVVKKEELKNVVPNSEAKNVNRLSDFALVSISNDMDQEIVANPIEKENLKSLSTLPEFTSGEKKDLQKLAEMAPYNDNMYPVEISCEAQQLREDLAKFDINRPQKSTVDRSKAKESAMRRKMERER